MGAVLQRISNLKLINTTICIVCGEPIRFLRRFRLQCGHTFHRRCIQNLFQFNETDDCPLCRLSKQ